MSAEAIEDYLASIGLEGLLTVERIRAILAEMGLPS